MAASKLWRWQSPDQRSPQRLHGNGTDSKQIEEPFSRLHFVRLCGPSRATVTQDRKSSQIEDQVHCNVNSSGHSSGERLLLVVVDGLHRVLSLQAIFPVATSDLKISALKHIVDVQ